MKTTLMILAVIATPAAAEAASSTPQAFDWTGFYAGVHAGALNQAGSLALAPSGDTPPDAALNPKLGGASFNGGLLVGYNRQIASNLVAGVEGDVGFADAKSTVVNAKADVPMSVWYADNNLSEKINGHVRGRLGWASGPLLVYGAAGVALSDSKINVIGYCPPDIYTTSGAHTLVGYSIGAGAEYALSKNVILRSEYIYDNYGHLAMDVGSGPPNYWQDRELNLETHTFRAAVSYKF